MELLGISLFGAYLLQASIYQLLHPLQQIFRGGGLLGYLRRLPPPRGEDITTEVKAELDAHY